MERLQVALEKARAQRNEASPETPALTPETGPTSGPETGTEVGQTVAPAAAVNTPASVLDAWDSLPEFRYQKRKMRSNRITTFEGGPESAPYDMLRTRLLQQAKKNNWRRIAIVSPHSNCGKSTVTANLAFSLTRQRKMRSMVFDFDLRRAGLTRMLGQTHSNGMADVLEGQIGFVDHGQRLGNNVAFGFNNGRVKNPAEILQSPKTKQILDEIEATYAPEIMLFDMPPLMASDDNFGFLQNVDAALLLVAAEKTTMSEIDVAERHIAELTNVMGIVLNKCRYMSGAHGYEYEYY